MAKKFSILIASFSQKVHFVIFKIGNSRKWFFSKFTCLWRIFKQFLLYLNEVFLDKQFDISITLIVVKARKLQLIFSFSATCNVSKVHFFKTWITWDWLEITRRFFRHYFFLIFLHQTHLFWKKKFRKFWKSWKLHFFYRCAKVTKFTRGLSPLFINRF